MKDYETILKTIITPLLEDSSSLDVKCMPSSEENVIKLLVIAHQEQISRLIGKEGRNANAIRQLIRMAASSEKNKVFVDFESY